MRTVLILLFFGSSLFAASFEDDSCEGIPGMARVDCYPEEFASESGCLERGCCWHDTETPGMTACFFRKNAPAFSVHHVKHNANGLTLQLQRQTNTYVIPDRINRLRVDIMYETASRLRLRITDPYNSRWEPPLKLDPAENSPHPLNYRVAYDTERFGLQVFRNSATGDEDTLLLDSTGRLSSALLVGDQFWQIAFKMNAQRGFGPGERRGEFPSKLDKWERLPLWARDMPPTENSNLYGVHNFFMGLSVDGTAFGIFLLNSNAQEVVIQPLPAITYRTIGGILDFFVFIGPSPADVISQYIQLIGRPPVPPYWALGFQLSKYGFKNVAEMKAIMEMNQAHGIPLDVLWADIDFMDGYKDWSLDKQNFGELGTFVHEILHKKNNMKAVIMFDAGISTSPSMVYKPYLDGLASGIFINDSRTGKPLEGLVWPGISVYPDYEIPETEDWLVRIASDFYNVVPFDGVWTDMNEPSNFYDGSNQGCIWSSHLDHPPFIPQVVGGSLYSKTICPSALHKNNTHYNLHNMYGHFMGITTYRALRRIHPQKRPFVLSRSTFAGSGHYVYHWTGDNYASWSDLKKSIAQVINFNMFGIPLVGADICGFNGNAQEELCVRWSQLGAFYPFSRNHNSKDLLRQDPAAWSINSIHAIRDALMVRYRFLPYLYSLFYRAQLDGHTVFRALAFNYPHDLATHSIDEQFFWGDCLLITPVVKEGATGVYGYLPKGDWISIIDSKRQHSDGKLFYFDAPLNVIPLHVKAGCILPTHPPVVNTVEARDKGIGLMIILSHADDGTSNVNATAQGELFWDDGETVDPTYTHLIFSVANRQLQVQPSVVRANENQVINMACVVIVGFSKSPSWVLLNDQPVDFIYDFSRQTVVLNETNQVNLKFEFIISWKFE